MGSVELEPTIVNGGSTQGGRFFGIVVPEPFPFLTQQKGAALRAAKHVMRTFPYKVTRYTAPMCPVIQY
jgi:hypothetical protein